MGLDLATIAAVGRARHERWHNPDQGGEYGPWTGADWSNAMCGEAGEAANIVKKLRRHETHVQGGPHAPLPFNTPDYVELLAALGDELADVILYLDLVAMHYGIDLEDAVRSKFNRVSEAQGFPERL